MITMSILSVTVLLDCIPLAGIRIDAVVETKMQEGEMKRSLFSVNLFLIVAGFACTTAFAQPYPNRPIQLVIPSTPGSALDLTGRPLAEELGKILNTQVIAMNKPGAAGTLAVDFVAKGKKDGYTLAYTNTSAIVYAPVSNPETVLYDPFKDLEPLGLHLFFPLTVTVQENAPWKSFDELISDAKKNPGKIRMATHGQGSIDNFNMELIQSMTGVEFNHIPFKGGPEVVTALLGGHVDVIGESYTLVLPHVTAGKFKILVASKKIREFPNIPTMTQLGYKQDLLSAWFAIHAPVGIPEEVGKTLVPAIEKAVKSPGVKDPIEKMGYIVEYKSPAELKKLSMEDYETAKAIAIKTGLRK
jgi:tripartite-type tricarboxylate transporter receptor subunit TctC